MTDENKNIKEEDLDLDEVSLDLDIDDDLIIPDDEQEKKEEIGIKIKIRNPKASDSNKDEDLNQNIKKNIDLSEVDETQALIDELKEDVPEKQTTISVESEEKSDEVEVNTNIFALRTTANREDQVVDFLTSNAEKKKFAIYSIIRPHGMRGYVFVEAESREDVEQAIQGVPYARGLLPSEIQYSEIEHMLEQVKKDVNIKQNDIVEIISGPFKRESAKIIRVDKSKEDVVVELLQAAVPIPITLKMDSVKVIRRETGDSEY
jgi:transcription termination/antitermination protein NusG